MVKTLGVRAVDWSLAEMKRENPPSGATKALWFKNVERGGRAIFQNVSAAAAAKLNHCAAAACYAAIQAVVQAQVDPADVPHDYRAAAKELMADAGRFWRTKRLVLLGEWRPAPGDLAIYDRSIPGRPETSWWGHVDRVMGVGSNEFENIGANEGPRGEWIIQTTRYDHPRLLGFIEYPREGLNELSPAERRHVESLQSITADMAESEYWDLKRKAGVVRSSPGNGDSGR